MMSKKHDHASAPTRALEILKESGKPFEVHEYEHTGRPRSFGQHTVEVLGQDGDQVFKTLLAKAGDEYVVGMVPVSRHLSLKALAKAAGHKSAEMADPHVAERRTGYVVGGVSPLGQTTEHRIFVDESAFDFDTFMFSGGKRGLQVEMSPWDFLEVSGSEPAAIATAD